MEGAMNDTRLELPGRFRTFVACICRVGPATGGLAVRVTVTFAGVRVPEGKLMPVTLTVVSPVSATLGDVFCCSVTIVCACSATAARTIKPAKNTPGCG